MIKLKLLESEIIRLERNNITGKIDHPPIDGCFTGDTQILLADNEEVEISELVNRINSGKRQFVYTVNENTHEIEVKQIEKAWLTKKVICITHVILNNGASIRCTNDHRFMLSSGSYCKACNLKSGYSLMSSNRLLSSVKVVEVLKEHVNNIPVYDLQIADNPNFMLACGVFVHNSKDIADSLAGSVFNAMRHESELTQESEDLLNYLVDVNDTNIVKPGYKKVMNNDIQSTAQELLSKLKSDVKTKNWSLNQQTIEARRQAAMTKSNVSEDDYQDYNDGILI